MTFWGDQVADVKARADLVSLVGRYSSHPLKRSGNHHSACCLFHNERTPSMHIYDDGSYHCFGCGAHGDVFSLVIAKEGIGFQEAVAWVARDCGMVLENRETNQAVSKDERARLYAVTAFACAFFASQLWTPAGEAALAYLRYRKFSDATLRTHRIGWAPDSATALIEAAKAQGHDIEDLIRAGLVGRTDERTWSFFRRRITVPILDPGGQVVAFSSRLLDVDVEQAKERGVGKYINNAETPIFRKGAALFNLAKAKGVLRALAAAPKTEDGQPPKRPRLIVVEGALDAIAADQAGLGETVAPCGTALTADQATIVARAADGHQIIIALDGDKAGRAKTEAQVRALLAAGAKVHVAEMEDGADPAEVLVEEASPERRAAFDAALDKSTQGLPWLMDRLCSDPDAADEHDRLKALDEIIAIVRQIPDADLGDIWLKKAAQRFGFSASTARRRAENAEPDTHSSVAANPPQGVRGSDAFTPPAAKYMLNETGNAHRFRDVCAGQVRYCHTWAVWLVWRGTHWQVDDDREVERRMVTALTQSCDTECADLRTAYEAIPEEKRDAGVGGGIINRIQKIDQWKIKNLNDRAITNSLNRASSLEELAITDKVLDRDPWLFSVRNGTVDLRTSEVRPHNPDDYITRLCPTIYKPDAWDDRFAGFLEDFAANEEMEAFLQRAAGQAMTGLNREDAVFMWSGPGGTGKTTLTTLIVKILGGYARPMPFELFLTSNSDKRQYSLAEASQCRLVVCEESEEARRFNASLVKQVSGGSPIECARKYGHPFSYEPKFKVWFVTNNEPYVSDTDDAFWRRLHLIKSVNVPVKSDPSLKEYLLTNAVAHQAVLAWMIAGAKHYAAQGLAAPDSVKNALSAYREEQDPLLEWITDYTILEPSASVTVDDLRRSYETWCGSTLKPVTKKSFSMRLARKGVEIGGFGYDSKAGRNVRVYSGIRLLKHGEKPKDRTATDPTQVSDDESVSSPQQTIASLASPTTTVPDQAQLDPNSPSNTDSTQIQEKPVYPTNEPNDSHLHHDDTDTRESGAHAPTREGFSSSNFIEGKSTSPISPPPSPTPTPHPRRAGSSSRGRLSDGKPVPPAADEDPFGTNLPEPRPDADGDAPPSTPDGAP